AGASAPTSAARYARYPGTSGTTHGEAKEIVPASSATPAASSSGPEIASSVTEFTPLRVGSEVPVRTPGPLHRTYATPDRDVGPEPQACSATSRCVTGRRS